MIFLAMTYLAHHIPLTPEANEPDFKMESFGKLLSCLDRKPSPTVHKRGKRLGMDASDFPWILCGPFNGGSPAVESCVRGGYNGWC